MSTNFDLISDFHKACDYADISKVEQLLNLDKNLVNTPTHEDYYPLMTAAKSGNQEAVTFLLKAGANIDALNRRKETALLIAAMHEHLDIIMLLLQAGARNLDAVSQEGLPAIWYVAYTESDDIHKTEWKLTETLLKAGAKNLDAVPQVGGDHYAYAKDLTLIWWAANWSQWNLVKLLLQAGARNLDVEPPEAGLDPGTTILFRAAKCGEWEFARQFIQLGAKVFDSAPRQDEDEDLTAFCHAFDNNNIEMARLFLEKGASLYTEGRNSLDTYRDDIIKKIEKGAQDKTICFLFEAALSLFSIAKKQMSIEFLRPALTILGSSINGRIEGNTALHVALENNNFPVIEQLLLQGADLSLVNKDGKTPEEFFATPILTHKNEKTAEEISAAFAIRGFAIFQTLSQSVANQEDFSSAKEKEEIEQCAAWILKIEQNVQEILKICIELNASIQAELQLKLLDELEKSLQKSHSNYIERLRAVIVDIAKILTKHSKFAPKAYRKLVDHQSSTIAMLSSTPMDEGLDEEDSIDSKQKSEFSSCLSNALRSEKYIEPKILCHLLTEEFLGKFSTVDVNVRDNDSFGVVLDKVLRRVKKEMLSMKESSSSRSVNALSLSLTSTSQKDLDCLMNDHSDHSSTGQVLSFQPQAKQSLKNLVGEAHASDTTTEDLAKDSDRSNKKLKH